MLYTFTSDQTLLPLPLIPGLQIKEKSDAALHADIGQLSLAEARNRFASGHKAYVAYLDNQPAAFGWVATAHARIGELNHAFPLPADHRYLWNFRTLPAFRGLGIYPHLLQYILSSEPSRAACWWIMHAPENKASQRGILKAGFNFMGKVSVLNGNEVVFNTESQVIPLAEILDTFGFKKSKDQPATCWNCSSPYLKNRIPACCCAPRETECTQNIYAKG